MAQTNTHTRRGGIYLVVLATVMLVALLGTAGVLAQTRQRQRARGTMDSARAATMAQAAIELGLQRIENDDSWRNNIGGGVWYNQAAPTGDPNDGVLSLAVGAPGGGALSTAADAPYELVALGEFGNARRQVSLAYESKPTYAPMACLNVGVAAGAATWFESGASLLGDAVYSSHGNVSASSSSIFLDVESTGFITGTYFLGSKTQYTAPRQMPVAADVLAAYQAMNPVTIDKTEFRTATEKGKTVYFMENNVLAPGYNPYGANETHPQGVYLLDMGGEKVYVENFRMHGTLILVEPRKGSDLVGSVNFEPAVEGYPCLIATGNGKDVHWDTTNAPLSESTLGVNFNPPGAAYQGVSDADMDDEYPSKMVGISYIEAASHLHAGAQMLFEGHVITGSFFELKIGATMEIRDWSEARDNPPPGFRVEGVADLVMGPWVRDLD